MLLIEFNVLIFLGLFILFMVLDFSGFVQLFFVFIYLFLVYAILNFWRIYLDSFFLNDFLDFRYLF